MENSFSLDTTSYKEAKERAAAFLAYSTTPIAAMNLRKKRDTGIWHIFYRPASGPYVED